MRSNLITTRKTHVPVIIKCLTTSIGDSTPAIVLDTDEVLINARQPLLTPSPALPPSKSKEAQTIFGHCVLRSQCHSCLPFPASSAFRFSAPTPTRLLEETLLPFSANTWVAGPFRSYLEAQSPCRADRCSARLGGMSKIGWCT